jgi:putative spermidine/putrescine transport system permease protein
MVWLLLAAAYFLIPLFATFLFSLRSIQTNACCSLAAYHFVLHNPDFWHTIRVSFTVAAETIALSLLLFVPTVYWVHLKVPRLRSVIAFLALIPFVVPPIVLVVGLLKVFKGTPYWFYDEPTGILAAAYVILAFPYMYFSLDAGFRAIDVHTLTEASQSLGASWPVTLVRVILPNIRAAALAGSFLALAIVMGEFTIANLAQFHTFPIFLSTSTRHSHTVLPPSRSSASGSRGRRCSVCSSSGGSAGVSCRSQECADAVPRAARPAPQLRLPQGAQRHRHLPRAG